MPLDTLRSNPLREGLAQRSIPDPCTLVIFGATGDLTHRKLVPALYNLAADGALPPAISVVGFARRDKSDEVFRTELEEAARKFSRQAINDDLWKNFAATICYHRSEFDNLEGYESLARRLDDMDAARGTGGNRLFTSPQAPTSSRSSLKTCAKVDSTRPIREPGVVSSSKNPSAPTCPARAG